MADLRDRVLYPPAGWLSLGLVAVMALALAWSVQGAGWLPQLDYLAPLALYAVLLGGILGVLPVSIVVTLPLGALIGAFMVLWTVGGEYFPELTFAGQIFALRDELATWILVVVRTGYPAELSPYAIGLGALMWVTAFIASYAVYRHNRVLDAIVLLGAALITNMSATFTDLFGHLLLFVAAALLLWLRASLVNRQEGWQRRRVNENLEVPAAILRSGILFAGASVLLAWALTSVAVAAPLTNAWHGFDGVWSEIRDQFDGVFGSLTNPQSRIAGNSFGSSFTVSGSWVSSDEEALRVAASRPLYMRTATYDRYTGQGWERTDGAQRQVAPGEPLFGSAPTPERPTVAAAVTVETITVETLKTMGRNLFTAGSPLTVFAPTVVHESGGQPVLGGISSASALAAGEAYQLNVAISDATEAELEAAGTAYPEAVTALYLDDSGATDRVRALAAEITAGQANPYRQAKALARYLSSDESFSYSTTPPERAPGQDLVDFFLFDEQGRIGYCEHYASAMVVMARSLGLPARVAGGFAPGERGEDGTYLVREANLHAWAEIYFPDYGWQIFEATKTIDSGFTRLSGDPAQNRRPSLTGIDDLFELEPGVDGQLSLPSFQPVPGAVDPTLGETLAPEEDARGGNALIILTLVVGLGLAALLRVRYMRHRWRMMPAGDRAWQQLTLAAGRAGVGPRPSETIYEYAGWLEEQLPREHEPIRTVADGKVWQAYSGRRLTATAGRRLDAAIARLRRPLLWLTLRRQLRNFVRRRV